MGKNSRDTIVSAEAGRGVIRDVGMETRTPAQYYISLYTSARVMETTEQT